ncbi:MAG: type II toxin-antitoxin system Phd/YefM family antitoxin [Oscillospiraceae bacterium]
MVIVNITTLRKDVYNYVDMAIKYNQPITVTTKEGNAVILSEEEYNGLMETLYLTSVPGMKERLNEPLEEMVDADKVDW